MVQISKSKLERLRKEYQQGVKVILTKMDDSQAPPIGTVGTVRFVDDTGTIFVSWATGSGLGVVYGQDKCIRYTKEDEYFYKMYSKPLKSGVPERVLRQFEIIRSEGKTNMYDVNMVSRLAYDKGLYALVCYIADDYRRYGRLIMTGDIL